ncbi:NAD-glutamate dehydrogenase [Sesbania bispinosa]|nr:NAD-glutamate dehydrogenase [Sesbania bispinosa]
MQKRGEKLRRNEALLLFGSAKKWHGTFKKCVGPTDSHFSASLARDSKEVKESMSGHCSSSSHNATGVTSRSTFAVVSAAQAQIKVGVVTAEATDGGARSWLLIGEEERRKWWT